MTLPTIPFVVVLWNDAWGDSTGVVTKNDVHTTHKPEVIGTAGWLLHKDHVGVTLVAEFCTNDSYRGQSFIPAGMIEEIWHVNLTVEKIEHGMARTRKPRRKSRARSGEHRGENAPQPEGERQG